jgi:lysophospholipid acyltransferase (LPLAT)-like uncharacterized protein
MGNEALAVLAAALLRLLGRSWRVRVEGPSPFGGPEPPLVVGAIWHRSLFIAAVLYQGSRFAVPVSRSSDGERIAAVLRRMGFADPPRGSSSHGGTAVLRSLLRGVREGRSVAILTDGPRGPARQSKSGVVALARLSGVPITPASFSASPCWRIGSWDGSLLPLPFARVTCRYAEPIEVPRELTAEAGEALRTRLDAALNRDTDELDDALGLFDPNRGPAGESSP